MCLGRLQSVQEYYEPRGAIQIGDSGGSSEHFTYHTHSPAVHWEWGPLELGPSPAAGDFPTNHE